MWVTNNYLRNGKLRRAFPLDKCQEIQDILRHGQLSPRRLLRAFHLEIWKAYPKPSKALVAETRKGLR